MLIRLKVLGPEPALASKDFRATSMTQKSSEEVGLIKRNHQMEPLETLKWSVFVDIIPVWKQASIFSGVAIRYNMLQ